MAKVLRETDEGFVVVARALGSKDARLLAEKIVAENPGSYLVKDRDGDYVVMA